MRISELGLIHRNEKSGTLHGLMRVRCSVFTDVLCPETLRQLKVQLDGSALPGPSQGILQVEIDLSPVAVSGTGEGAAHLG